MVETAQEIRDRHAAEKAAIEERKYELAKEKEERLETEEEEHITPFERIEKKEELHELDPEVQKKRIKIEQGKIEAQELEPTEDIPPEYVTGPIPDKTPPPTTDIPAKDADISIVDKQRTTLPIEEREGYSAILSKKGKIAKNLEPIIRDFGEDASLSVSHANGFLLVRNRDTGKVVSDGRYLYVPELDPLPVRRSVKPFGDANLGAFPHVKKIRDQGGFYPDDLATLAAIENKLFRTVGGKDSSFYNSTEHMHANVKEAYYRIFKKEYPNKPDEHLRANAKREGLAFMARRTLRDAYLNTVLAKEGYTSEGKESTLYGELLRTVDKKEKALNYAYQFYNEIWDIIPQALQVADYGIRVGAQTVREAVPPALETAQNTLEKIFNQPMTHYPPRYKTTLDSIKTIFMDPEETLITPFLKAVEDVTPERGPTESMFGIDLQGTMPVDSTAKKIQTGTEFVKWDAVFGGSLGYFAHVKSISRQKRFADMRQKLEKTAKLTPASVQRRTKDVATLAEGSKFQKFWVDLGLGIKERPGVFAVDSVMFGTGAANAHVILTNMKQPFAETEKFLGLEFNPDSMGSVFLAELINGSMWMYGRSIGHWSLANLFKATYSVAKTLDWVTMKKLGLTLTPDEFKNLQKLGVLPPEPVSLLGKKGQAARDAATVYKSLAQTLRDSYSKEEIVWLVEGFSDVLKTMQKLDPDGTLKSSQLVSVVLKSVFLKQLRDRTLKESAVGAISKGIGAKAKGFEDLTTMLKTEELELHKLFDDAMKNIGRSEDPDAAYKLLQSMKDNYDTLIKKSVQTDLREKYLLVKDLQITLDSLGTKDVDIIKNKINELKKTKGFLDEKDLQTLSESNEFMNAYNIVFENEMKLHLQHNNLNDSAGTIGINFENKKTIHNLNNVYKKLAGKDDKSVRGKLYTSVKGYDDESLKIKGGVVTDFIRKIYADLDTKWTTKGLKTKKQTLRDVQIQEIRDVESAFNEHIDDAINNFITEFKGPEGETLNNAEDFGKYLIDMVLETPDALPGTDAFERLPQAVQSRINRISQAMDENSMATLELITRNMWKENNPLVSKNLDFITDTIEVPLVKLVNYKTAVRTAGEDLQTKGNFSRASVLWKHEEDLKNYLSEAIDAYSITGGLDVETMEGLKQYKKIAEVVAEKISWHWKPFARGKTAITTDKIRKVAGEAQLNDFLIPTRQRSHAINKELFDRLYPPDQVLDVASKRMVIEKRGGKKVTLEKGDIIYDSTYIEQGEKALNMDRQEMLNSLQDMYMAKIIDDGVTPEKIEKLIKQDSAFFTEGIGQHFKFIDNDGTMYTGRKFLEKISKKADELKQTQTKEIANFINASVGIQIQFKKTIDMLAANSKHKLFVKLRDNPQLAKGGQPTKDAEREVLELFLGQPNIHGGSGIQAKNIMKTLNPEQKKHVKQVVMDSLRHQFVGDEFAKYKVLLDKKFGGYINLLAKIDGDASAFLKGVIVNRNAMIEIFGEKTVRNMEDITSVMMIMTEKTVGDTLQLPGGLTVQGFLARAFAIARGVVSYKFIAADVTIRMLQKSGTKFLKNLASNDVALQALKDMLIDGKFAAPRAQREFMRELINTVRHDQGNEELAQEGEILLKSGQLPFTALSREEAKKRNLEKFGNKEGLKIYNEEDIFKLKQIQKQITK